MSAEVLEILTKDGKGAGLSLFEGPKDPAIQVPAERIFEVCQHLKSARHLSFEQCLLVTGTHMVEKKDAHGKILRENGFEVMYHLRSLLHHRLVALKVKLPLQEPRLASVSEIWAAANWHERETYDLVGIDFTGHPNLKRILLPEDWEGFPLRKDYVFPKQYQGINLEVDPAWPQP